MSRRILIDASSAVRGGGFTYLVNLLPRLAALAPDTRFRVLLRSPRLRDALPTAPNVELELLPPASWPRAFAFTYARAGALARAWGAQLYFSTAEYTPLRTDCPSVASFRNPNVFDRGDHRWPLHQRLRLGTLRRLAALSARRCARVLFVSDDSSRWIGERMHIEAARRAVVHHGVDLETWSQPAPGARPIAAAYVLSVSSVYRYKNFVRLIQAWHAACEGRSDPPHLVIVGDAHDRLHAAQMREARGACGALAERVHLVGEVPYAEVRAWYSHALLFAFPSYLETFGHPLLEAMASGLPVLAADTPVFREIAGDAVRYADPFDADALAEGLRSLCDSAAERERLARAGRARAAEFSWDRCAERTLGLFDELAAGPGRQRA